MNNLLVMQPLNNRVKTEIENKSLLRKCHSRQQSEKLLQILSFQLK